MPEVLTDEEMGVSAPATMGAAPRSDPVLSDAEMDAPAASPALRMPRVSASIAGASPAPPLNDHQMGLSAPVLSDADMGISTPPKISSPAAPVTRTFAPEVAHPQVMAQLERRSQQLGRPLNKDEEVSLSRATINRMQGGGPIKPDSTFEEQRAGVAAGNNVYENFGQKVLTNTAEIGTELIGTVAPEYAMQQQDSLADAPIDENSLAAQAGGIASGGVIKYPGYALGPKAAAIQEGLLGAGRARIEAARRRRQGQDISGGQEAGAAVTNALVSGAVGALGSKALPGGGNPVRNVAVNVGVGGGLGAAQQVGENAVRKFFYNDDQSLTEGVLEAGLRGALTQGLVSGIHEVLRGSPSLNRYFSKRYNSAKTPEERAQVAQDAADFAHDYQQARQQEPRQKQASRPLRDAAQWDEPSAREELGLPPNGPIGPDDLKAAFRGRVMQTHPDVGGSDQAVQQTLRAHDFLRDLYGERPVAGQPSPPVSPTAQPSPDAPVQPQPTRHPIVTPEPVANQGPEVALRAPTVSQSPGKSFTAPVLTDAQMIAPAKAPQESGFANRSDSGASEVATSTNTSEGLNVNQGSTGAPSKPENSLTGGPELTEPLQAAGSRHHGAVYIGWLDPVVDAGKTVAGAAGEAGKGFVNLAVRDMVDRVRVKGTPSAKQAADLAERTINTTKAAAGSIVKQRDRALTVTGAGLSLVRHKVQIGLQRVNYRNGKSYGSARIVEAVEGKIPTAQLSAGEQEAVNAIRELTDATGKGYRANGVQQFNHKTGQWQPFNYIPGGNVFVRLHSPDFTDAILHGRGKVWDTAIDAFADLNPQIPRQQIEDIFQRMHSDMIGEGPQGAFSRVNAEFTREIPNAPTHVMVGGQEIPLFETNPHQYAKRLADHYATRVGFVKHFGQELQPGSAISKLREAYLKENGDEKALVELTRALNGVPVERPLIDSGSAVAQVSRWANNLMSIAKAGMLSASSIQNLAEPLGNLQAASEGADYFKAAWRLVRSPAATIAAMEQLGAVNTNPADLAWNPSRPGESLARIIRESSSRVFGHHFVNELQEKMAGAIAMEKVQRMAAGKGTAGDVYDLRALGMPLDKARRLAAGKGTPAEYNEVVRKMPPSLVGSPITGAEKTRLSHNRIYRAAIAFETYAQMKVRGFLRNAVAYADIAKQTRGGLDNPQLFFRANWKFARYLAGTTASGALGYFLMALATGGTLGLKIAWEEAKDEPLKFLRDSFLYTMFAGPYGAVLRTASGDRPLGQTLLRTTLPGFLLAEVVDAVMGNGSYSGMNKTEAMSNLAGRLLPINKIATQAAATMGFGEENQKLDVAVRAYYRWKGSAGLLGQGQSAGGLPDQLRFRNAMKRAYIRMRAGDTPGMQQAMQEAAGVKGEEFKNSRAQSILARRLLSSLKNDQLAALQKRIGAEAVSLLQAHDTLLEAWAASLGKSSQSGTMEAAAKKDVPSAVGQNRQSLSDKIRNSDGTLEQKRAAYRQVGIEPPADLEMKSMMSDINRQKRNAAKSLQPQ